MRIKRTKVSGVLLPKWVVLLSPIGRYDRNPPAEFRPNAGKVLPVALGIKRNFPLHMEACNDQLRLIRA